MFPKPNNVSHSPSRGPFRRPPKRLRVSWSQNAGLSSDRRGDGVRYGALDLTPTDHHSGSPSAPDQNRTDRLKIAVLGGNEEVGKNMTLLEYGDDILLIDMGIQFAEEHMLGVDGCVPDLSYLKGKESRVRGVIITHMHNDHIGAIPYLMPLLPGVPVFSAPLSLAMIAKKLEYTPEVKVDLRSVDDKSVLHLGEFTVRFIGVSHSVPAAMGIVVDTPVGRIVHTGDFKVDRNPQTSDEKSAYQALVDLGGQSVLALLADSTNATQPGRQLMEHDIEHDLDKIFKDTDGRLLFGMISTNVERLGQLISCAERHGRHVFIGGLSLKTTFELASELDYLKPKPGTIISIDQVRRLPANKIVAIFPGAQGELNGAFFKLADGTQRDMDVEVGDTVIFSSSVIPGNERAVQFITDKFFHRGARVINYRMLDVHSGGHARYDDLKEAVSLVKPKYLVPIEGHHAFLHAHADAAKEAGLPAERILIARNAQVMEFDLAGNGTVTNQFLPQRRVLVRNGVLDQVDDDTLRERRQIGEEGVLIVQYALNGNGSPHVTVRSQGIRKESVREAFHRAIATHVGQSLQRKNRSSSEHAERKALEQMLQALLEERYKIHPYLYVIGSEPPVRSAPSEPSTRQSSPQRPPFIFSDARP